MIHDALKTVFGASDTVVVNGAGPVGLTFTIALLDRATQLGIPKPKVQIWDPIMTPRRETVIRLPHIIATLLPEQVQMELWQETTSAPRRLFMPGPCNSSVAVGNSHVHDPVNQPACQLTATIQIKQFQEVTMRYLLAHHAECCTLNHGRCPPDVMRGAAAVIQSYGKAARKSNPIVGNSAAEEDPIINMEVESENGLFVLFDRKDVVDGDRAADYNLFNERGNGFTVFQSHDPTNAVQAYIWPEDVNNDLGCPAVPLTQADLIANGNSFGLRALFDCVDKLQGQEQWWWEVSRRCRLQDENGMAVPREMACTLEWRRGHPGSRQPLPQMGEKASSDAFEAWFDAVRYQISLNMYKMGIFGSRAENFLCKVRFCYARREPYRYNSVFAQVEGVPVIYLGDSAGSTDFKKGLSCGRGLLCASQLAVDAMDLVLQQLRSPGCADLRRAFQLGAEQYQLAWRSTEMCCEWRSDFDATYKYLQAGRCSPLEMQQLQACHLQACLANAAAAAALRQPQFGVVCAA